MTIRSKPSTREYRDGWDRVFDDGGSDLRAYRVTLAERFPPANREGISYVVTIRRRSRHDAVRTWAGSLLVVTAVEVEP